MEKLMTFAENDVETGEYIDLNDFTPIERDITETQMKGRGNKVNNNDNLQEDILQFAMMFEQLDSECKMFMLDFLRALNEEETNVSVSDNPVL